MDQKTITKKLIKKRKDIKTKLKALKLNRFQTEHVLQPFKQLISYSVQQNEPKVKLEKEDEKEKKFYTNKKNVGTSPIKTNKRDFGTSPVKHDETFEYSNIADHTLQDALQGSYIYDDSISQQNYQDIGDYINRDESFNLYLEDFDEIPREYVKKYIRDTESIFDTHYLNYDVITSKFRFGDSEMDFKGNDVVIKGKTMLVKDKIYKGTYGLYELLFKNRPNESLITPEDRENFKNIMQSTNAHKRNFIANEQTAGNRGEKYKYVIKPLLDEIVKESKEKQKKQVSKIRLPQPKRLAEYYDDEENDRATTSTTRRGRGLLMQYNNKPFEYVHWDDPNGITICRK
ncbi:unnamed protein product [Brassicogethes aeneus]|uniref:DUF8207 domain-containing protein n=1 Tax=Brassicogethes aeneus TaxID=1431903 RepID=A0A9P0FJ37_BRAAE|nr:unnamed protein product [Brassicogethes aeneus]